MPSLDQIKGSSSEDTALRYFQHLNYKLIARNFSIAGIELDLILKRRGVYYIVEVKSNNLWRTLRPVSKKQMDRIKRAAEILSDARQASVLILTAIVRGSEVQVYPLDD